MEDVSDKGNGAVSASVRSAEDGRYLYSIINAGAEESLGNVGIDDCHVYSIPYRDIAAIVHSCPARPYETKNDEKAKEWIIAHGYVIDLATHNFGTVLPFSFDVIVRGDDNTVREWLKENYESLKKDLQRVQEKAEYSVQIFCDVEKLSDIILNGNEELTVLKENIENMPKGSAYLHQRKLELKIKDGISGEISKLAKEFSSKIRKHTDVMEVDTGNLKVPDEFKDKTLVVTLSCLVHDNMVDELGEVLGEINNREGFAVRFTGPWAPFSFVMRGSEDKT
jgi:hypothetical protein